MLEEEISQESRAVQVAFLHHQPSAVWTGAQEHVVLLLLLTPDLMSSVTHQVSYFVSVIVSGLRFITTIGVFYILETRIFTAVISSLIDLWLTFLTVNSSWS